MQFVFCILFYMQFDWQIPLKKSSRKCFNKFVVIYHFKYTWGQSGQRPKLCILFRVWYCCMYVRFFLLDLPVVLILWFWDKKKKKIVKKSQKGPAKKVNKVQVILCFNQIKIMFLLCPCDHLVAKQKKISKCRELILIRFYLFLLYIVKIYIRYMYIDVILPIIEIWSINFLNTYQHILHRQ